MALQCIPSTFRNPVLFGAEILSINARLHQDFSFHSESIDIIDATFCNVTVTYTHPGQGDSLNVEVWLPPADQWNKRLQAVGGGGFVAGGSWDPFLLEELAAALKEGYAAATRDAGFGNSPDSSSWALLSEGNLHLYNLQNLASTSLDDEAIISKSIIADYYGMPPKYSYWNGCSQGGRQGLKLAQGNPNAYDGILAIAPAINWNGLFMSMFWPQLIMSLAGEYPHMCEIDTLSAAAIAECDSLDGVIDGVISSQELCNFDPYVHIGHVFNCSTTGTLMEISEIAAKVARAAWSGPRDVNGKFLWYGHGYGADFTGHMTGGGGIAMTSCSENGTCRGIPSPLVSQWFSLFMEHNPGFDLGSVTHEYFGDLFQRANQAITKILDTNDPDLSRFKAAGGKMLTWHGLDDQLIPSNGTSHYYKAVTALDPGVHDFYRYFEAPGVQHCGGGAGGVPNSAFHALVDWVENGKAPDSLPIEFRGDGGSNFSRFLCPYPSQLVYDGVGDPKLAESFSCQ